MANESCGGLAIGIGIGLPGPDDKPTPDSTSDDPIEEAIAAAIAALPPGLPADVLQTFSDCVVPELAQRPPARRPVKDTRPPIQPRPSRLLMFN